MMFADRTLFSFSKFSFQKFAGLSIICLLFACAREVAPTGGPKDTEPPVLKNVYPVMHTTGFDAEKIVFSFDEFFTIKNPTQTMFFNPLPHEEMRYKIKGKKLIVFLPASIQTNQTYSLNLINAVADFHEGNLLPSLKYVFSTGIVIDSLSITGRVVDAYTLQPEEKVRIYLFSPTADSVLLKKQFAYFSTSDADGNFVFSNLPHGSYALYVLKDMDFDHTYNTPDEKIGFVQHPVHAQVIKINDSLSSNVVNLKEPVLLFQDKDTNVRIVKVSRVKKGLQQITFNNPVQRADIRIIGEPVADSVFTTLNEKRDTLSIWFLGQKSDYAKVEISVHGQVLDTISLTLKHGARGAETIPAKIKVSLTNNFDNDRIHFNEFPVFKSTEPIKSIETDKIFVIYKSDTLQPVVLFSHENPLSFGLKFHLLPNQKYTVVIPENTISDFAGRGNDSLSFNIHTTDSAYYGTIVIAFDKLPDICHIIELHSLKTGKKYEYFYEKERETYAFHSLIPGEYSVRMILDENCNRLWDTGDFRQRKQPEKIIRLPGRIMVKSGWETEIRWSVEY